MNSALFTADLISNVAMILVLVAVVVFLDRG